MKTAPKSLRLHIGLFGRRNVGKSSVLNAVTRQSVSIVSEVAGTTTDPVEKPMEILPLGPVLFIDTAGVDDMGSLGKQRIGKTKKIFDRTDIAVIVAEAGHWGSFEEKLLDEFTKRNVPAIVVLNKIDIARADKNLLKELSNKNIKFIEAVATEGVGISEIRTSLIETVPESFINPPSIVGDLLGPDNMAVLVVPIDKEAPKGRLILPQVQVIRDILESDSYCTVVKERELSSVLERFKEKPKIVITDSQAFLKVAADTPEDVLMTSFSILFARFKGDLNEFVSGASAIEKLESGDKVLVAESCSHHQICEDIGIVKIPRWLRQYTGCKLEFDSFHGYDFTDKIQDYKLVIQCGGCMWNRRQMLSRISQCKEANVPITNYGVAISYCLGIFERALKPFSYSLDYFKGRGG